MMSPGKFIYHLWHRPLGSLKKLMATGGPIEHWKTSRGCSEMARAASDLPPVALTDRETPNTATLHFLSGNRYWFQTAFCLYSFLKHCTFRGKVLLHDDGTLQSNQIDTLRHLFPGLEHISVAANQDRIQKKLPVDKFPTLHERLSNFPLMKKIMYIHTSQAGWNLFFDSDQLFFRKPTELSHWIQFPDQPMHAIDSDYAYGYTYSDLLQITGSDHIPQQLNTGIHALHSDEINWEQLESWCKQLMNRFGAHYFMEQAMIAMLIGNRNALALPAADYIVHPQLPEVESCSAILHHYVADSKKWYFRSNWKLALTS